jgi:signal transduction histidine kinase
MQASKIFRQVLAEFQPKPFSKDLENQYWEEQTRQTQRALIAVALASLFGYFAVFLARVFLGLYSNLIDAVIDRSVPITLSLAALIIFLSVEMKNRSSTKTVAFSVLAIFLAPTVSVLQTNKNEFETAFIVAHVTTILGVYSLVRMPQRYLNSLALVATVCFILAIRYKRTFMDFDSPAPVATMYPFELLIAQCLNLVALCAIACSFLEVKARQTFAARNELAAISDHRLQLIRQTGHDLQQPLAAAVIQLGVQRDKLGKDTMNCEQGRNLQKVEASIELVRAQLEALLQLTEVGKTEKIPISEINNFQLSMHEIVELMKPIGDVLGTTIVFQLDKAKPISVDTNLTHLTRVLVNVLDNSLRYAQPEAEPDAKRNVWIETEQTPNQFILHFRTSGRWIEVSEANQPSLARNYAGRGIGLQSVRMTVERLPGHDLRITKERSTVTIKVPLHVF